MGVQLDIEKKDNELTSNSFTKENYILPSLGLVGLYKLTNIWIMLLISNLY